MAISTRIRRPIAAPPRSTLTEAEFFAACAAIGQQPNAEQRQAIAAAAAADLHLVAGPGTGKTSSLTLRILKCILVDGLRPSGVVATTFTKKAAAELRSRLLVRGFALLEHVAADERLPDSVRRRAGRLDINQIVTNTVDGLCQQVLRDHREPGTTNPVIVDEFVASTLMLREGLFADRRYLDADLDAFLQNLSSPGTSFGWNIGRKRDVLRTVWDRRFQDQLDWSSYCAGAPPQGMAESITAYEAALADRDMVDFTMLEQTVLDRLQQGRLDEWAHSVQAVFVDEYQDTNLLQECLYFALAGRGGASLTIVGDDDQSLYRFRGATVDLFRDFPQRAQAALGRRLPTTIFLTRNYRSTPAIVDFVNGYAALDPAYQAARVAGKPPLIPAAAGASGPPVLAMFRPDAETLADDLADLLSDVFQGGGYRLPDGGRVRADPGGGLGDAALLCSSPKETNGGGRLRLPGLLRRALADLPEPMPVFNPRGEDVAQISLVAVFGGLLLEAIDPDGAAESSAARAIGTAAATFSVWRAAAVAHLAAAPALAQFHAAWAARRPRRGVWPRSIPALKLIYALAHYFPELHDDPEGQIYLEVFTRQLGACETLGTYRGDILAAPASDAQVLNAKKELLSLLLAPIASGGEVNEELIEAFPRNRLPVLSIHQAKGLEFPLVIVDVGADFRGSHHAHAFKRFPRDGGLPHRLEDDVRAHSPLALPSRSAQDRAFDDLYRQYFVAFSRPETVLILAGLDGVDPRAGVQNIATGWRRDGTNPWARRAPFVRI